jgi:transposase
MVKRIAKALTKEENMKRIELYEKGFDDEEIAKRCDISKRGILSWRRKYNLPSVSERKGKRVKRGRLTDEENRKRIKLYEQGLKDKEIAEKCDVSKWAIFSWRKRLGLPSIPERGGKRIWRLLPNEEEKKRIELYEKGFNDREIAEKCDVPRTTISFWRRKCNLPSTIERGRKQSGRPLLTKEENEKRFQLYKNGFNDREIAEKCNVSKSAIHFWREKHDLPPVFGRKGKRGRGRRLTKEENGKRIKLYEQGFSDREIAEKCGVSFKTISLWRREHNLPSATERKGKKSGRRLTQEEIDRRIELYNQGLNDKEIAQKMGLAISSIQHWRKKNNLPPNRFHKFPHEKRKNFLELYEKGFNDREIAERLNLSPFIIYRLRKKHNLKAHRCRKKKRSLSTKEFQAEKNFIIRSIRSNFVKLTKHNPLMALKIAEDMEREEGKEFMEMCLGDLFRNEDVIDKKALKIMKKYGWKY